jgi:hypothetical protein
MPDHVEAFTNDVSEFSTTGDGYSLTIHGNLKFAGTVLAAEKVSVRVNFKGVRPPPPPAMYAILDTASPSVLKLPVDWPVIKVPVLSRSIYRLLCFRLSPQEAGSLLDSSQIIVASIQSFQPCDFPIKNVTAGVLSATILTAGKHTGTEHKESTMSLLYR